MTVLFDILENPEPTSHLWKQWKNLIDTEGWTSDDNSVTGQIPYLKTTRSVFAVTRTQEQKYVGSVVWNEYDDICWLGFYILAPEYRGKGIGSIIWERAMSRYSKKLILGLRGVVAMANRYKSRDTPFDGALLENYRMSSEDFHSTMRKYNDLSLTHKFVNSLSPEEWKKLIEYDQSVTGRDRHEFLEMYYKTLEYTAGIVFFDEFDNIVGLISVVPTSHQKDNRFKISPLYANSEDVAFYAMKVLSNFMLEKHPKATLIFHLVDTPEGSFTVLHDFFKKLNLTAGVSGFTLYSNEYKPKGDVDKVFIPHNNSCHFDY